MADNGDTRPSLVQAGASIASQLVRSLAPQFLALVIVNVIFLAALFWFVDARAEHTASVLNQLLSACLQQKDKAP